VQAAIDVWQTERTMTFCSIIIGRRVGTAAGH
jgi:hypothetical protein